MKDDYLIYLSLRELMILLYISLATSWDDGIFLWFHITMEARQIWEVNKIM